MHISRTRFKKDIVAEYVPPTRHTKKVKVIVFCLGAPSVPKKDELLTFYSKKGYWVFFPRYRGSWESGGEFLKLSPHKDVIDILDGLSSGFKDVVTGEDVKLKPDDIHLFGASFGGPAVLLASNDPRVTSVVALSPVVDWQFPSKAEPLDKMASFFKQAFGEGYRFPKKNFNKLMKGTFYNPVKLVKYIDGRKVHIVHNQDDDVVLYKPVPNLIKKINATSTISKRGGHLGGSAFMKPAIVNIVHKHIKKLT